MTDSLRISACQQHPKSDGGVGCPVQSVARRLLNESFKNQITVNYYQLKVEILAQ
ncbi:hypothetical protein OQJ02_09050 [Legionella sp. PATHC032]|uniref:hypothetical protein n=1 Tax=Legionella sp. PATHC032 TaxID=2992039 RepID=UPI001B1E283E|nr:hypothetical protein [Legionella sp. PATHC032]MCW8421778.1 hypothetical protein [Legionella sp. PATHC032]HAZ7574401.1 hypothetical protein [Legionella pneumophila]HBA1633642.1 hypothetical protein [Legionella pneumophila]